MTSKVAKRSLKDSLPSYKKPPINEVVCGFRYKPLGEFKIPHIGLLWEKFRNDYPGLEHAIPIATDANILVDASTGAPIPRVWFISSEGSQLVQFQADRYYFNWRQRGDVYPRYSTIIRKFERAKTVLDEFVEELHLGAIEPIEYELTYINQIPKGQGWETADDLPKVFTDFNWERRDGRFLSNPTNTSWRTRFALPEDKGWLTGKLSQGKRKDDEVPVLVFELAAKGIDADKSLTTMRTWFDLAHEWIVRGFADLTTDEIQRTTWEREDAAAR